MRLLRHTICICVPYSLLEILGEFQATQTEKEALAPNDRPYVASNRNQVWPNMVAAQHSNAEAKAHHRVSDRRQPLGTFLTSQNKFSADILLREPSTDHVKAAFCDQDCIYHSGMIDSKTTPMCFAGSLIRPVASKGI